MDQIGDAQAAFGVRACARRVRDIFLARWRFFVPVALAASTVYMLGGHLFASMDATGFENDVASSPESADALRDTLEFVLFLALATIVGAFEYAVYVMAAYDTKAGTRIDLFDYLRAFGQNFAPLAWSMGATAVLMMFGLLLFIVPAIWIACIYAVVVPAVMIDRSRFGALRRSRILTRGHRWPILGLGVLIGAVFLVVQVPIFLLGLTIPSDSAALLFISILGGAINSIIGITAAVGHMRLTELEASPTTV